MGLFTQKPEEDPADWAGLPAEPHDPLSPADRLGIAPEDDPLALVLGEVGSISIPLSAPLSAESASERAPLRSPDADSARDRRTGDPE